MRPSILRIPDAAFTDWRVREIARKSHEAYYYRLCRLAAQARTGVWGLIPHMSERRLAREIGIYPHLLPKFMAVICASLDGERAIAERQEDGGLWLTVFEDEEYEDGEDFAESASSDAEEVRSEGRPLTARERTARWRERQRLGLVPPGGRRNGHANGHHAGPPSRPAGPVTQRPVTQSLDGDGAHRGPQRHAPDVTERHAGAADDADGAASGDSSSVTEVSARDVTSRVRIDNDIVSGEGENLANSPDSGDDIDIDERDGAASHVTPASLRIAGSDAASPSPADSLSFRPLDTMTDLDRELRKQMVGAVMREMNDASAWRPSWVSLWNHCWQWMRLPKDPSRNGLDVWKAGILRAQEELKTKPESIPKRGAYTRTTICNLLRDEDIPAPQGTAAERAEASAVRADVARQYAQEAQEEGETAS